MAAARARSRAACATSPSPRSPPTSPTSSGPPASSSGARRWPSRSPATPSAWEGATAVPPTTDRVLQYVDDHAAEIVAELAELVRVPSVSGSDEENAIQHLLAARMAEIGMDVDTWQIPLVATLAEPGFPGVEVERRDAWGVVGRLPGRAAGPSLLLNAHVDVVPTGDPTA